ncbi:MAG: signal peptidase I [Acidimicrobiales bacterium]
MILAAGAVILATVIVPRAAGATPYTITTGSMAPAYPPGTLIVVRPVAPLEVSVGDVITVQLESGRETLVTHRVVGVHQSLDGRVRFQTQGDANGTPDAELRLPVQLRGKVWYAIPAIGRVSIALRAEQRRAAVDAIGLGLLAYGVWMFASAWRDHRSGSPAARMASVAATRLPWRRS